MSWGYRYFHYYNIITINTIVIMTYTIIIIIISIIIIIIITIIIIIVIIVIIIIISIIIIIIIRVLLSRGGISAAAWRLSRLSRPSLDLLLEIIMQIKTNKQKQ